MFIYKYIYIFIIQITGYANPAQQNKTIFTPGLDRLAAEGVSMQYSVSSTPTCTPARAGILTGRRPWGHGMLGYASVAKHYPLSFPQVLSDAGYVLIILS